MTGHQLAKRLLELPDHKVITLQTTSGVGTMILGINEIPVSVVNSTHLKTCEDCKPTTPTVIEIWMD